MLSVVIDAMANSPSLWHSNYRGAVYPIDYHAAPARVNNGRACQVKTLVDLAAENIVQDAVMTAIAMGIIPRPLCEPLMKEALFKNREKAVGYIIQSWPQPALVLRDLVPELFTSIEPFYNSEYQKSIVKQGLRYTTNLVHTYLEVLKKNSKTKLKFLDVTGFPTAEVIVYFLATHCMLAHNEVRHETIRNMYDQAVQQAGSSQEDDEIEPLGPVEPLEPLEHSLPQDCSVTVKLDAFITSESIHCELCKALKVSTFQKRKLRIIIGRLAITCLGQALVSVLLEQVHPQHLTGLQLQYNAMTAQDFVRLAPALKTLVCLESLDLACNTIFFHKHEPACIAAAEVFEAMPRLHRLDLSNNIVKTRLRRLLENIARPLSFLRLVGCALAVTDFIYLSHSIHGSQLTELDLSENSLKPCCRQVKEVISASRASLCVLELQFTFLDASNIIVLLPCLSQLTSLMFVNFSQIQFSQDCLVSLLTTLSELVTLQVFKCSYSVDCYAVEGEEERLKAAALAELNQISNRSSVHNLRVKPLMLFLSELDQNFDLF